MVCLREFSAYLKSQVTFKQLEQTQFKGLHEICTDESINYIHCGLGISLAAEIIFQHYQPIKNAINSENIEEDNWGNIV